MDSESKTDTNNRTLNFTTPYSFQSSGKEMAKISCSQFHLYHVRKVEFISLFV